MNKSHDRIEWVDNAKALVIFLVVFAHNECQRQFYYILIYSFHMPLFFFISGYLLKEKYLADEVRFFLWRAYRTLIIPYVSFWIMSFIYRISTGVLHNQLHPNNKVYYIDHIYGLIFGTFPKLAQTNGPLWFLTCLFCTMILFYWLSKIQNKGLLLALLALLGSIGPMIHNYVGWRLPWNLELSFVAVVFYSSGYIVSKFVTLEETKNTAKRLFTAAIFIILLITIAKINGMVNMARMQFGNLLLYYLGAFSGIGLTIQISQIIPNNACFKWLSRNTIVIFATNMIIFSIFNGLSLMYLNINPYDASLGIVLVYTIASLAICYPISIIINRHCPWMVGYRELTIHKQHPLHLKASKPTL